MRSGTTAALGVVALVLGAGIASAYLTTSGSGVVSTRIGGPQVYAGVSTLTGQIPGGEAAGLPVTIHNDGSAAFVITEIVVDAEAFPTDCPASAWILTPPEDLPTVRARSSVTVTYAIGLREDAPSRCQGADLTLPIRLRGVTR